MEMLFDQTPGRSRTHNIPESLIYEILDGRPVYRKGYRQVLNGTKTLEAIMPASTLQSAILSYLLRLVFRCFDEEHYFVFTNEPGLHLNKRVNLAGDILIFDKKTLKPGDIDRHFAKVPPIIHMEVDIDADTEHIGDMQYITTKTRRLLAFGVQKVIWIFTHVQSVVVAEHGQPWQTLEWKENIEIGNGAVFNLKQHLEQEGIHL